MLSQFLQVTSFMFEELSRNQVALAHRTLFHSLGGPLSRLQVNIFEAVELPTGQEVGFERPETSLFASLSIGMIDRVADEHKAVRLTEGYHLRNDHGMLACAFPTHQVGIVDDAYPARNRNAPSCLYPCPAVAEDASRWNTRWRCCVPLGHFG